MTRGRRRSLVRNAGAVRPLTSHHWRALDALVRRGAGGLLAESEIRKAIGPYAGLTLRSLETRGLAYRVVGLAGEDEETWVISVAGERARRERRR